MVPERDYKNKDTHFCDLSSKEQFNEMIENLNRNSLDLKAKFKELDDQAEKEIKRLSLRKDKDVVDKAIFYRVLKYVPMNEKEIYSMDFKLLSILLFFYFGVWLSNLFLGSGFYFLLLMFFYYFLLYVDVPFLEKLKQRKELKEKRRMLE